MTLQQPALIECSGTPYEIGRQYGEAARENILKSHDLFFVSMERGMYKVPRYEVLLAADRYLDNVRGFAPEIIDHVQGIADGAGITFEESFALKCWLEISIHYPQIVGMCTSFAVTGAATRGGGTILGQNVDWHPETPIDLVHIRHADGMEQMVLCLLGNFCYYLNSAGIGNCANLTISPLGPVTSHIPFTVYLWKAMRQFTLDGAMEILQLAAKGIGYYHLADKQGKIRGIESIYDDFTVIQPENDVLVHANHYETEKYKNSDLAYTFIKDSFGRADRLRQLIAESYGDLTPELFMSFLADHQGHPNSVCSHVDETQPPEMAAMSKASFIMVPEEMKLLVAFGPPCENRYWEYSLVS
jgi:isopenicillin-N N-acyltransferase-like protein